MIVLRNNREIIIQFPFFRGVDFPLKRGDTISYKNGNDFNKNLLRLLFNFGIEYSTDSKGNILIFEI